MKTLENIIKKARAMVLPLTFLAMPLFAQNNITGHVESVPSKSNAYARVTLKNTTTNTSYVALTNPATGTFWNDVPTGNYDRKVETQNNYLFEDNLTISAPQSMDIQTIENLGAASVIYDSSILKVTKILTGTYYSFSDPIMERWHDSDIPIKFYNDASTMPAGFRAYLDSSLAEITAKSNGNVTFSEQTSPVDIGINFTYVSPYPYNGFTEFEEYYPDNSPKKVKITLNKVLTNNGKNITYRKELMRALGTTDDSEDPIHLMSAFPTVVKLSDDEGKVLQIMYTLDNLTDMSKHKYTVITDPVPVELTAFNATTKDNIVNLAWKTATEVDNYGFEIERKKNEWQKIGFMPGHGNSNSPKEYTFKDTVQQPGKYTYRLKQLDNDGDIVYSPEVNVDLSNIIKDYFLEQNYPNPFNPETKIQFSIPQTSNVTLKVYDMLGSEVQTLTNEKLGPGTYTETFNGKDQASGTYLYRIQAIPEDGPIYNKTEKMQLLK